MTHRGERRTLPERYDLNWPDNFARYYQPFLVDGMTILDIGSGRTPAIPRSSRPDRCAYIGLDISEEELIKAGPGAYDRTVVSDLCAPIPGLINTVDLAISWQVLEHIIPIDVALDNTRSYLKPGGHFVSMFSGRNAVFALANRLVPEALGKRAMKTLLHRQPDTVFRAHYDRCTKSDIETVLGAWTDVRIDPYFRGAEYLSFSRPLQRAYLQYENWAARSNRPDLATHYILFGEKPAEAV